MATKMLLVLHEVKEEQTKDKLFGALPQLKSVQLNSPASLPGIFQKGPLDSRTTTTTSTRFSHRTTLSARKPASFWREKGDTVVILVRGFAKMLSCHNKSRPL